MTNAAKKIDTSTTALGANTRDQALTSDAQAVTWQNACGFASQQLQTERDRALYSVASLAVAVAVRMVGGDSTFAGEKVKVTAIKTDLIKETAGTSKSSDAPRAIQRYVKLAAYAADVHCGARWSPMGFASLRAAVDDMSDWIKTEYQTIDALENASKGEQGAPKAKDPVAMADKAGQNATSPDHIAKMFRVLACYATANGADPVAILKEIEAEKASIEAALNEARDAAAKAGTFTAQQAGQDAVRNAAKAKASEIAKA